LAFGVGLADLLILWSYSSLSYSLFFTFLLYIFFHARLAREKRREIFCPENWNAQSDMIFLKFRN